VGCGGQGYGGGVARGALRRDMSLLNLLLQFQVAIETFLGLVVYSVDVI